MASLLQQMAPHKPKADFKARCAKCGDHGFTGCPEAMTRMGDLMAIAWCKGVACSCAAGVEFARDQMRWMEMES